MDKQIRDVATTGIIPTRMGTSDDLSDSDKRTGDHPHAYGDKAECGLHLVDSGRIIPTRMGTRRLWLATFARF